jgi:TRAP transporter TAXI family solute receptor
MMSSSDNLGGPAEVPLRGRQRKIRSLLLLATGLFFFAAAAGALYFVLRPTTLRIAIGPAGSDDHRLIQALAQALAREGSAVRLSLITTAGPVDSAALLGSAGADLAVARADDPDLPADAESVAIMRKNVVALWSPSGLPPKGSRKEPKPKIKAIDDLAGHRVGVVGRTEANVKLLQIILKESGVDPEKVAITKFGPEQVAEMTRDPKIDAFMTVGPIDSKITADAITSSARLRGEPKFLPIDVSEAIALRHPLYESEEITGSSFSSSPARPEDKIETVGVNHLILAPKSLSETTVGAFTRGLFAVRQSVAREIPGALKIEKPDTDKDAALTAHPGAAAYIDGTERTFMEKYSDYIWIAILLLSALGSGGAWLRHYLKREERALNTLHRDRLMVTIAKVRQANSLEELAEMQGEVEIILRETLGCYDDGAIEEGNLAAFGLVLEQFHHAVHHRRAVIGETATELPRLRAR